MAGHVRFSSTLMAALVVAGCSGATDAGVDVQTAALAAPTPGYRWPVPTQGWFTDEFTFPLPFAPQLPYVGLEELHQLQDFGTPDSTQFWSYDYLFWLDGDPQLTRAALERDLHDYYQGLCDYFGPPAVSCDPAVFRSQVVSLGSSSWGDRRAALFAADVDGYDPFFTGKPITLHLLLASVPCPRAQHRALLVAASPAPVGAGPWPQLISHALELRCQ